VVKQQNKHRKDKHDRTNLLQRDQQLLQQLAAQKEAGNKALMDAGGLPQLMTDTKSCWATSSMCYALA
jgi:hypothetical protein